MRSRNKPDTTDKLPHADDIRDFARRSLRERKDYKDVMREVRSAIQESAAKGNTDAWVWLHGTDETVARAVVGELTSAGYRARMERHGGYYCPDLHPDHYPDYYSLDISWQGGK